MFQLQILIIFIYLSACLISSNSFAQDNIPNKSDTPSGITQDLYYLMGYQAVSVGLMYHLPESVTGWSDNERDKLGIQQWKKHIQNPHWDQDNWVINYILHPYWGGAYYIRGRERGFSKTESFWVSVLFSTVYEFAVESFMEEPSIQDLIVTPIAGTALGIYFEETRNKIKRKDEPLSLRDKTILVLTDPLGTINRKVNSWLGINNEQQAMAQLGMSLLRSGGETDKQICRNGQGECGQTIGGVALTFRYTW